MADGERKEIIKQIQDFKNYTIIADKMMDRHSNNEILLFSLAT